MPQAAPMPPLPFVVEELDHVVLRCRDQARMLEFYVRVLGLVEERRLDAIGLIQLRAGRSLIDLVPGGGDESRTDPNVDHVCLAVRAPDVDAVVAHLMAAGVELIGEPAVRYGARGYGLSVYCRDPEGTVIELTTATAATRP
jgi:glyoxylase I family protein